MHEYRPVELLKTARDLCDFDAICVGGPLNGEFQSLGKLPMQSLYDVIESHRKSPVGNMRSFSYRLPSHMKYRLTLLRSRGKVYVAWAHESVPVVIHTELLASFDSALESSEPMAPVDAIDAPPFDPGDRVAPKGGYISDAVTVRRCFHRDGKWLFYPMHGRVIAQDCECWCKVDQHAGPVPLDEESPSDARDATPDPEHAVLTDDQMFGPTDLWSSNGTYPVLDGLMSSGKQYADSFLTERNHRPFRVGQTVVWKSKGTAHVVEAIKYVESEKCWAIRIPGHDRPYNASMFTASGVVTLQIDRSRSENASPQADPQPLGARPKRNIIRKERPQ